MYTIKKGFTTKKDVIEQFKKAGVSVTLGFSATNLKTEKNPFEGCEVKGKDKKEIILGTLIKK